ncbi:5-(carboxyamino)imidazole ribonucleotide synthase [Bacillus sp. NTK071]|uniref:5-(carboxyamino)imidazole ribonucleotide synthase n=1 Tax=Bacillus sp. NTK071 TaxID=2802175 RepID=UPI001A8D743B|nr:5-(carboxyamino)imidazole ribonucleotide synthase [Bacillus sp. NTK071]MBN8210139.1 5-(carboxyamino)imidazole ribonucleotide synthase [Bacillus sp. NTK071]
MNRTILPGSTIGILGGGQLGRMMALKAREMGYRIAVLEPKSGSPCGQVADHEVVSGYDDLDGARELSDVSDVITYEFENITHETAKWLTENAYMPQGGELLRITQDRYVEKTTIQKSGLQVAPFEAVDSKQDLYNAIKKIGLPSVLKTRTGGYDGKGQWVLRKQEDVESLSFPNVPCILESWVPFQKELSVIVTRSVTGETATFPVGENIHVNNILHQTIVPARVDETMKNEASEVGKQLANNLNLVGTLAVELFLKDNELYVNELAPRPHNSGHYTMEACETSQFEQHIRAICGLPLGSTKQVTPVVMGNLLGQHVSPLLNSVSELGSAKLHLYGKDEAKHNRKMGHVNFLASSTEDAIERMTQWKLWE